MMAPDVCRICGCIAAWVEVPGPPVPPHVREACDVVGIRPPADTLATETCARCWDERLSPADRQMAGALLHARELMRFMTDHMDIISATCECDDCRREREAGAA